MAPARTVRVCIRRARQSQAHAAELEQVRKQHAEALTSAHDAYDAERMKREALEQRLAKSEARASKTIERLQGEVEALAQSNANAERHLRESARNFSDEQRQLKTEWTTQVAQLAQRAKDERSSLGREVRRLRQVQESVLEVGGRDALTGDARRLLFYESMKSKALLQPDSTLTWRGQQEVLRAEKAAQTDPRPRLSPSRSPSPPAQREADSASAPLTARAHLTGSTGDGVK